DADEEPGLLHVGAGEMRTEAFSLERAQEVTLFPCVTEAGEPGVRSSRTEPFQEPSDVLRAAHGDDGHTLGTEISTASLRKRLERPLIADAFDEYDGTALHRRVLPRGGRGWY